MKTRRSLAASGAGSSFLSPASARSTIALGLPSFAGRSNSTTGTSALAQCAAICAPMTPAPSTATLRMMKLLTLLSYCCCAAPGDPGRRPFYRGSEVVVELDGQDVHLGVELAIDHLRGRLGAEHRLAADLGFIEHQIGVTDVHGGLFGELVVHAHRQPGAV